MSMNPVPNRMSEEDQLLIEEYLKNGGTVTRGKDCTYYSELGLSNNQWGQRRQKQKQDVEDTDGE